MDHPCHKCGNSVEDGKSFCAHCGAPQIRVRLAEVPAELAAADGSTSQSLAQDDTSGFPGMQHVAFSAPKSSALRPCALAAAIGVALMFLGLNAFVAALGAGFLGVTLSQLRNPARSIRSTMGAKLGAFSGLLLFGFSTFLETFVVVALHKGPEIRSQMLDKLQQMAVRYPSPEVGPFLEFVKSAQGFAFMLVGSLLFGLAAFLVLGGIGGAVSAAFVRRRRQP
jgi:hypothetical protein